MGRLPRYYRHGSACFVTNRLAEGLPFVPNTYVNALINGALARAASRTPGIIICAFGVMQNHYHLLLFIEGDEADMSNFLHDLDDELARIVKKLLGKRNVKVWAQRPHVAILGDKEAVIEKFGYCFLNPVEANFCARASEWIGVHSHRFLRQAAAETYKWVRTKKLKRLPNRAFTKKDVRRLYDHWQSLPGETFELKVNPFAWKGCFSESAILTDEQIAEEILLHLKNGEQLCQNRRKQERQKLADPEQLSCQNPHKYYKPTSYGRRVYCICTDPEARKQIIEAYKDFCEKCAQAWAAWKKGDFSVSYPPGAFLPPRRPPCSSLPNSP